MSERACAKIPSGLVRTTLEASASPIGVSFSVTLSDSEGSRILRGVYPEGEILPLHFIQGQNDRWGKVFGNEFISSPFSS